MNGAEVFNQFNLINPQNHKIYQDNSKAINQISKQKKNLKLTKESFYINASSNDVDRLIVGKNSNSDNKFNLVKNLILKAIIPNPDNHNSCYELMLQIIHVKVVDI